MGRRLLGEDVWLHDFGQTKACGTWGSLGRALFMKQSVTACAQDYLSLLFVKDIGDKDFKAFPAAIVAVPCEATHFFLLKREHCFEPNAFDGRASHVVAPWQCRAFEYDQSHLPGCSKSF